MGHEVTECGDRIHSKESCEWGDWLRVPFLPVVSGRGEPCGGVGRGRGRGRGRGGGRGDGVDDEVEDMDTSLGDDEDPDNLLSTKREGTDGDRAGQY